MFTLPKWLLYGIGFLALFINPMIYWVSCSLILSDSHETFLQPFDDLNINGVYLIRFLILYKNLSVSYHQIRPLFSAFGWCSFCAPGLYSLLLPRGYIKIISNDHFFIIHESSILLVIALLLAMNLPLFSGLPAHHPTGTVGCTMRSKPTACARARCRDAWVISRGKPV